LFVGHTAECVPLFREAYQESDEQHECLIRQIKAKLKEQAYDDAEAMIQQLPENGNINITITNIQLSNSISIHFDMMFIFFV
jgi:hypothetical protein